MTVTDRFAYVVEMLGIFLEEIIRGQVLSATKPLVHHLPFLVVHFKVAPVGVNRGHQRTFGMYHQAESTGIEINFAHSEIGLHTFWKRAVDS